MGPMNLDTIKACSLHEPGRSSKAITDLLHIFLIRALDDLPVFSDEAHWPHCHRAVLHRPQAHPHIAWMGQLIQHQSSGIMDFPGHVAPGVHLRAVQLAHISIGIAHCLHKWVR